MSKVNVVLIGGGGREHALADALSRSPRLGRLFVTHPQNPGLSSLGTPVDVPVNIREIYRLGQFCRHHDVGLVVIGPEGPLAEGYADRLQAEGVTVFGPTADAARLESDKAWCKDLLRGASIPTADARVFTDPEAARQYLETRVHDDPAFHLLAQRLAPIRDPDRRRQVFMAAVRLGVAALDRAPQQAADWTIVKDSGVFRFPAGDNVPFLVEARALAAAWRAARPDLPVIKASGLAAGKGVVVPDSLAEAFDAIDRFMVRKTLGDAARQVLIEERLAGPEVSVLAIIDGENILVLPPCKDHKRLSDGDQGPNTGGMGAICPAPTIDEPTMARVVRDILVPTVDALRRESIRYRGVLYAGLMLTPAGPKVLEFNCRFGDPECQPLMARLRSDALELMLAACQERLADIDVDWAPDAACCVVLASHGYPGSPRTGDPIVGLDEAERLSGVRVYHAGTARDGQGRIVTAGGRVLGITATGPTLDDARRLAYDACSRISFPGMHYRRDIGAVAPITPHSRRDPGGQGA
jgi:phosphoribosylamine--glycine ligase